MNRGGQDNAERVSLLGPKSDLKGDFVTDEELVILGRVSGTRVQAPAITIRKGASISGGANVKDVGAAADRDTGRPAARYAAARRA